MASHFFPARLRNFRGEAGHRANNALAERFRGELRYEASKTDGRCLEPVYRRSKSLSVRRVISRNPFCAALSRSSLPRKGRRNEKPTRERCNFLTVLDSSLLPSLSLSRASVIVSLLSVFSRGDRYPVSLGIVSGAGGQGFALSIGTEIQ